MGASSVCSVGDVRGFSNGISVCLELRFCECLLGFRSARQIR
jgi:hypothetical protein